MLEGSGPTSCTLCTDPCKTCKDDLTCISCIDGHFFQENLGDPTK